MTTRLLVVAGLVVCLVVAVVRAVFGQNLPKLCGGPSGPAGCFEMPFSGLTDYPSDCGPGLCSYGFTDNGPTGDVLKCRACGPVASPTPTLSVTPTVTLTPTPTETVTQTPTPSPTKTCDSPYGCLTRGSALAPQTWSGENKFSRVPNNSNDYAMIVKPSAASPGGGVVANDVLFSVISPNADCANGLLTEPFTSTPIFTVSTSRGVTLYGNCGDDIGTPLANPGTGSGLFLLTYGGAGSPASMPFGAGGARLINFQMNWNDNIDPANPDVDELAAMTIYNTREPGNTVEPNVDVTYVANSFLYGAGGLGALGSAFANNTYFAHTSGHVPLWADHYAHLIFPGPANGTVGRYATVAATGVNAATIVDRACLVSGDCVHIFEYDGLFVDAGMDDAANRGYSVRSDSPRIQFWNAGYTRVAALYVDDAPEPTATLAPTPTNVVTATAATPTGSATPRPTVTPVLGAKYLANCGVPPKVDANGIFYCPPTATPTPTVTATVTVTPTPTVTATATPTLSPTPTVTATPPGTFVQGASWFMGAGTYSTTVQYQQAIGGANYAPFTTEAQRQSQVPLHMLLSAMDVCTSADLAANQTVTFTLRVGGADTALTCAVAASSTGSVCGGTSKRSCTVANQAVDVPAHSLVSISMVCSGAGCPTANGHVTHVDFGGWVLP